MKVVVSILFSFIAMSVAGAPVPRELKQATLDGRWVMVLASDDGIETRITNTEWVIEGENIALYSNGGVQIWPLSFSLVPCKVLGDNAYDYNVSTGCVRPCRIEVTADKLKIAGAMTDKIERPLKVEPGVGYFYFEFKRVK